MTLRLYVVPASHPCAAVESALRMKGVDHELTELPPGLHAAHQRLRFGKRTVPAMKAGGEKVSGSRAIMRWLEERHPEPALWPADPEARAAVERAEQWGDEVLQSVARRVIFFALRRRPDAMPSFLAKSKLPVPAWAARLSGPLTTFIEFRLNAISEEAVRADLAALDGHLATIDGWVEEGVLGGETPNAADLQIGASLGELVRRWFADYPGSIPAGTLS
jgi:glutathione S-transferase